MSGGSLCVLQHSNGGGLLLSVGSLCVLQVAFKGWKLVTMSVGSLCVLQHSKGGGLLLCVWEVCVYCSIQRVEACYCECGQRWCVPLHPEG